MSAYLHTIMDKQGHVIKPRSIYLGPCKNSKTKHLELWKNQMSDQPIFVVLKPYEGHFIKRVFPTK
jgi:hypothetical protein